MSENRSLLNEFDGYDTFRRAIVEREADAWADCVARYRPLLISWASSSSASAGIDDSCGDIADQALSRAWSALSPERFAAFPGIAALLAYLRACVTAVVIDCIRAQNARQRLLQRLEGGALATLEQTVLDRLTRAELWRIVWGVVRNPQEQTILVEHFMLDMPPRAVQARHPELFADIADVYNVRRNLVARLQRHPDLRRLYREGLSA